MTEPTIRYVNKVGEFHSGIPGRDLHEDEYKGLDEQLQRVVRESPLYDYAGYHDKASKKASKEVPPAAPAKPTTEKQGE